MHKLAWAPQAFAVAPKWQQHNRKWGWDRDTQLILCPSTIFHGFRDLKARIIRSSSLTSCMTMVHRISSSCFFTAPNYVCLIKAVVFNFLVQVGWAMPGPSAGLIQLVLVHRTGTVGPDLALQRRVQGMAWPWSSCTEGMGMAWPQFGFVGLRNLAAEKRWQ